MIADAYLPGRHGAAAGEQHRHAEYRIEDLAYRSGATVRTIRAYQDRGLLPRPERRGRSNVYDDAHLARLRQISDLLERGHTLASIKELLDAWDEGRGLSGVLGLVAEVEGPWTNEQPERLTGKELDRLFGGAHHAEAVAEAVALGVLVPLRSTDAPDMGEAEAGAGRGGGGATEQEGDEEYAVPSPTELAVAAELHRAGVPLLALTEHLRELRSQVEHIAARFLDFTNEHVFVRYLGVPASEEDATEAAGLVRRLRPLAQQAVDAELARAMRTLATRQLRGHLRSAAATAPAAADAGQSIRLPCRTLDAVRELVGPEHTAAFVAAATEREVQARTMDRLTADHEGSRHGESSDDDDDG